MAAHASGPTTGYGVARPAAAALTAELARVPAGPGRGWASRHVPAKREFLLDAAGLDPADLTDEAAAAVNTLAAEASVDTVAGIGALLALTAERAATGAVSR